MAIDPGKSILETVLKTAHEKAIPHDPPEPKTETPAAKPPVSAAPVAAPKNDDAAKELAAAKARAAELEAKLNDQGKTIEQLKSLEKVRELWKGKKRIEAIQVLSEAEDIDAELDEFVKDYVASPSKETKNAVEAKLDQLLEREAKKDEAAAKAKEDEAKRLEQDKIAAAAKAKEDNVAYTASILAKHADKFDLCLREKHKKEAGEKAPLIALEILKRDKIDLKTLTAEQGEKAMLEALMEIESDLEKEGIANYLKKPRGEAPPPVVKVETAKEDGETAKKVPPPEVKLSPTQKPASVSDVIEKLKKRAVYQ